MGPASSFSPWMRLARHDRIWEGRCRRILLVEASVGAAVALRRASVRVRWSSGQGRSLSTLLLLFIGIKGSTRGVDVIATVAMEKEHQAFQAKRSVSTNATWIRAGSGRLTLDSAMVTIESMAWANLHGSSR